MTVVGRTRLLLLAGIGFGSFVMLAFVVHAGPAPGDEAVTRLLSGHCPSVLLTRSVVHQPCPFGVQRILHDLDEGSVSQLFSFPVWTVLVALAAVELWRRRWRSVALALVLAELAADTTAVLTKALVGRIPPPVGPTTSAIQSVALLEYPSGHILRASVSFGVLLAAVVMRRPHLRLVAVLTYVVVLLLLGAARVAAEAHWPSDVLGSYLAGGAWVLVMLALPLDRWLNRARSTRPATPAHSRWQTFEFGRRASMRRTTRHQFDDRSFSPLEGQV